jgi:hypothetical protein
MRHGGAVLFLLLVGWALGHFPFIRSNAANRDSIQFWATGRMLVQHTSPFDLDTMLKLQQSQGYSAAKGLVSRIPPWTIPLTLPCGLLSPYWTWFLVVLLSGAVLVFMTRICWDLFGNDHTVPADCYLACYLFAPVLACFKAGQIGILIALGIVMFLRWQNSRPFLAGAALWLPFAKPHLFTVFGLICILWIFARRQWAVLAGFGTTLFFTLTVAVALDHNLLVHYLANVRGQHIEAEFIPSLAGVLRLLAAPHVFYVQFVPLLLGLIWAIWFWTRQRSRWEWSNQGLTLLVVSVLVSPYSFFPDEVVLLPVVFKAAAFLLSRSAPARTALYVLATLNFVLFLMVVVNVPLASAAYVWSGLLWGWCAVLDQQHPMSPHRSQKLNSARATDGK